MSEVTQIRLVSSDEPFLMEGPLVLLDGVGHEYTRIARFSTNSQRFSSFTAAFVGGAEDKAEGALPVIASRIIEVGDDECERVGSVVALREDTLAVDEALTVAQNAIVNLDEAAMLELLANELNWLLGGNA